MTESQQFKELCIKQILDNPVYMPESGLYQHLKQSLLKLPKKQLEHLQMILELKQKPKYPSAISEDASYSRLKASYPGKDYGE